MKNKLSLLIISFISMIGTAQNVAWVKQGKAPKTEYGNGIAFDNDQFIYVTGKFQDSIRFDQYLLTEPFGTYCVKYDTSGNVQWAIENVGGDGITYNGNGALYLYNNQSTSIQKLDLSGNVIWNNAIFNSSMFGTNGFLDVFCKGNDVYATGFYSGNATFTNSTLINNEPASGDWDIFITKLNDMGADVWIATAGGNGLDKGYDILVDDNDNIYTTGYFRDTANFSGIQKISNGIQDLYIAKYDSNGNVVWVNTYGGTGFDMGGRLTIDNNANLYTMGRFNNTVSFGSNSLTATGSDVFIAKTSPSGSLFWTKAVSGMGNDEEAEIQYIDGKVNFIATTAGTVTLNSLSQTQLGGLDMCFGTIDTTGTDLWLKLYGGSSDDEANGIVCHDQNIYFSGNFKTTANFDTYPLVSQGQWDMVVGKIGPSIATTIHNSNYPEQGIIFPNPATDKFFLQTRSAITSLEIYNLSGKLISTQELQGNRLHEIKMDLPEGLYLLKQTDNNSSRISKLTIVK